MDKHWEHWLRRKTIENRYPAILAKKHVCEVCKISYDELPIEHHRSNRHKRKLKDILAISSSVKSPKKEKYYYCKSCNVYKRGIQEYNQHLEGKEHGRNKEKEWQKPVERFSFKEIEEVKLILDAAVYSEGDRKMVDLVRRRKEFARTLCSIKESHQNPKCCPFCFENWGSEKMCEIHRLTDHSLEHSALRLLKEKKLLGAVSQFT